MDKDEFLEYLKIALYPCIVECVESTYIISYGTPEHPFTQCITKQLLKNCKDTDNLIDMVKKQIRHTTEKYMFTLRYDSVLDDDTILKTPEDYIIMVDTAIRKDKKILVMHPETYNDLLLSGKVIHSMQGNNGRNWKKRMEGKKK